MKITNHITKFKKQCELLLAIALSLSLLGITSSTVAAMDDYKTRLTPEGRKQAGKRGTYSKDNHVWVYNSRFAKRFGMPQEWVDDDLKGAEALAYRLDLDLYGTACGYFGELETCRAVVAWVVDMYIEDQANLPWTNETRFDSTYVRKSNGFLRSLYPDDKPAYLYRRTKRGNGYTLGLDSINIVNGKKDQWNMGNYRIYEYDRDIYKDMDYISGSVICRSFGKARHVKMNVKKAIFRDDGSISPKSKKNIVHRIKIPNSFMQRIETHDKAQYEPHSLFKSLQERLGTTTKIKK